MKICYHGTDAENAQSIPQDGFCPGSYFSRHLEDAISSGETHVFEVAFDDPPDHWKFSFNEEWVKPDRIIGHTIYQSEQKTNNQELRTKVIRSSKIPLNRSAKWREFNHGEWAKLDEQYDHVAWEKSLKNCTAKTLDEWIKQTKVDMKEAMKICGGRPPFRPTAWYNVRGDMLEVYLSEEESYAKWLNPQVSVLLAFETDEVIGFQIWGLSRVENIQELPDQWKKPKKSKPSKSDA